MEQQSSRGWRRASSGRRNIKDANRVLERASFTRTLAILRPRQRRVASLRALRLLVLHSYRTPRRRRPRRFSRSLLALLLPVVVLAPPSALGAAHFLPGLSSSPNSSSGPALVGATLDARRHSWSDIGAKNVVAQNVVAEG